LGIVKLLRFESSAVNGTTDLDGVVSRRKQGQTQIYYIAGAASGCRSSAATTYHLVDRLGQVQDLVTASEDPFGLRFQDVAKDGVTFGDEDADEKAEDEHLTKQFQPLDAGRRGQAVRDSDCVFNWSESG
jgi:heat shock protein beta